MKLILLKLKAKYYELKADIYVKKYGIAHIKTQGVVKKYLKSEIEISVLKLAKEEK